MEKTGYKKKLIEVAMPLEAINKASVREKIYTAWAPFNAAPLLGAASIGGVPSGAFAQLVDDPSAHQTSFRPRRTRLPSVNDYFALWRNWSSGRTAQMKRC